MFSKENLIRLFGIVDVEIVEVKEYISADCLKKTSLTEHVTRVLQQYL